MPHRLAITPVPYTSSLLAIPPTPFSPLLPITPPASPPLPRTTHDSHVAHLKASAQLLPPPPDGLRWLWQCHHCHRVYPLGVTRRCLDDGHVFCAGTTAVKRKRGGGRKKDKVARHAACASEFDYQGWKDWGLRRRELVDRVEAAEALMRAEHAFESEWCARQTGRAPATEPATCFPPPPRARADGDEHPPRAKKDCWMRCDYPSECRWGRHPIGVPKPSPEQDVVAVPREVTASPG